MRRSLSTCAFWIVASLSLWLSWPASSQSAQENRVALLVGVADYALDPIDLTNPINDVDALEPLLSGLGFKTTVIRDQDHAQTVATLDRFETELANADVGLFFFAGHGLQINGENYLMTRSITEFSVESVTRNSIALSDLRQRFQRTGPRHSIIVLDACRNTPDADDSSDAPGLALTVQSYPGFLIAYATDPGNVALDGEGENSTFTQALLDHLGTPGLDLRLVFGRVRQDVVLESGGEQVPWVEESLLDELILMPALLSEQVAPDGVSDEIAAWQQLDGSAEDLEEYLTEYRDGLFAPIARQQLQLMADAAASPSSAGEIQVGGLADSDTLGDIAVALEVLGFLPESEEAAPDDEQLQVALRAYASHAGVTDAVQADQLKAEAARMSVVVGGVTSQRMRSDMNKLESIKKTRVVAEEAIAEIKRLYGGTEEGEQVLREVAGELDRIDAAYDRVLARLDVSREYYDHQLKRTAKHFRSYVGVSGSASGSERGLSLLSQDELALSDDVDLFVRHVIEAADPEKRGSMAWLSDFIAN